MRSAGNNAFEMFALVIKDSIVKLLGVEIDDDGLDTMRHAATLSGGTKGFFHGVKIYILPNGYGQRNNTYQAS